MSLSPFGKKAILSIVFQMYMYVILSGIFF